MKLKDCKNFKGKSNSVPQSSYFSKKKPALPEHQTFSGQSKAKK